MSLVVWSEDQLAAKTGEQVDQLIQKVNGFTENMLRIFENRIPDIHHESLGSGESEKG